MSSAIQVPPPQTRLATLPLDQSRGVQGMWAVIATELMLFVCMFGAYYYLGSNKDRWAVESPPELKYPLILLIILLSSSILLVWGERQIERGFYGLARQALWGTVFLGIAFVGVQSLEYLSHWKRLTPYSDSYGSIFYAITSLHAAHVIVGLLLLMYVGILPRPHYGPTSRSPHNPYKTVAIYWHFVDFVWIFIVLLLYVVPHFQGGNHVH
jgi:heme/copper-type cytochrome/quinol oxidase subunit 3